MQYIQCCVCVAEAGATVPRAVSEPARATCCSRAASATAGRVYPGDQQAAHRATLPHLWTV